MPRDYYLVLGIPSSATAEEIHAAFRRRSRELLPDLSDVDSSRFQELQAAFAVLGDPERRREYDRVRLPAATPLRVRKGAPTGPPRRAQPRELSLVHAFDVYRPSFDELFTRWWGNFQRQDRPKGERPENLTVEVIASREEARTGGRVRVGVPAEAFCPLCRGRGRVGGFLCSRCNGAGAVVTEHWVNVDYPAGLVDGTLVTVPLSHLGIRNLYLTVQFRISTQARDVSL